MVGPSIQTHEASEVRYEPVVGWGVLSDGMSFLGDATSVTVGSDDLVYVFNRGTHPLVVFDRDGSVVSSWNANGDFDRPHGIAIDGADCLFLVDEAGHFVDKRTNDGELIFRLGTRGKPAEWQAGSCFNRPTDVAVHSETGDIFITDGYGNSRVHRFDSSGKHLLSWGSPGTGPGAFSLPHGVCLMGADRVVVCDRENFRLQVFDWEGGFVEQWHMHHPAAIVSTPDAGGRLIVGEMGPPPIQGRVPNLGHSVSLLDWSGWLLGRLGSELPGAGPGQFIAPHSIAVDSRGDVYVAEVSSSWYASFWGSRLGPVTHSEAPSLRKWRRCT